MAQPCPKAKPDPDEVAHIYLQITAATLGSPATAVQAALAMSIVLIAEQRGLAGEALHDWIDTIARTAKLAAATASTPGPPN